MNYIMYIAMAIIVLCWVLTPFLRKIVLKKVSSFDFLLLTHSIVMLFILLAILVMKIKNKKNFKLDFSSMDKKDILVLILASVGTFVSSLLLIWLLKYNEATSIMPQLQPLVILLTILAGAFVFKENVSLMEWLGVAFIIGGVFILNKFKTKKS